MWKEQGLLTGVSNPWPAGHMPPRMAMNMAQHKIVNLLKTLWDYFVIMCCNVFNVWPKTTLLPVWHRNAKSLDTPGSDCSGKRGSNIKCEGTEVL